MTYSRPGIYVTEGPFTTNVTSSPATVAAAFVGTAERGPTTPALVTSWNSYKNQFGDLTANYEMGYALYHFFSNGGRSAYVTRVTSGASTTAVSSSTFTGTANSSAQTVFKLRAPNSGTWGNAITATVSAGTNTGTTPTFNLAINYNGTEVENWSELSLNPDNARYIAAVLNTYSSYVQAYDVMYNAAASAAFAAGTVYTVSNASNQAFTAGANGDAIADADWARTLRLLDNVEGQLTINLVGQSSTPIITNAISYVDGAVEGSRKNSFLVIDPDKTLTTAADINTRIQGYGSGTSYAAVYYPTLSMSNPAVRGAAALRDTYPGGAILGLYQRVDAERGVGRAPAGYAYTLQNAFGTSINFNESTVGTLYNNHVNTLKSVPGAGVIVNGARTLIKTDNTKYIPSRRTLNFVKAQVEELTKPALFQPNGSRLWTGLAGNISKMLNSLYSSGALAGNSPAEAFYIVCDDTNNTSVTIDAGEVNIEVGIALQTPAEFIVINVSQFTGGSTVTETL